MNRKSGETSAGWMLHMAVFCAIAMVIGVALMLGWQKQWLSWPLFVVDSVTSIAAHRLMRRYCYRIGRMGLHGASRARWWFELSGLVCTLTMALGVTTMAHGLPGIQFPGANWIVGALFHGARISSVVFLVTSTIGMILGIAQKKRVRSRSVELVAWFYWSFVLMFGMCSMPIAWLWPAGGVLLTLACFVAIFFYMDQNATAV